MMIEKNNEKSKFYFWKFKNYAYICDMKNKRPGGFPET